MHTFHDLVMSVTLNSIISLITSLFAVTAAILGFWNRRTVKRSERKIDEIKVNVDGNLSHLTEQYAQLMAANTAANKALNFRAGVDSVTASQQEVTAEVAAQAAANTAATAANTEAVERNTEALPAPKEGNRKL